MQPHSVLQKNQLPTPLSYLLHHNTFTPTQPGYVKSVPNHQRTRQKLLVYRRSRRVDFHSNVPLLKHSFQGTMHTIDSTLFFVVAVLCLLFVDRCLVVFWVSSETKYDPRWHQICNLSVSASWVLGLQESNTPKDI